MTELWWLLAPVWRTLPFLLGAIILAWATITTLRARHHRTSLRDAATTAGLDVAVPTIIVGIVLLTFAQTAGEGHTVVLIPFADGVGDVAGGETNQYVANLVMFAPLGLLLPMRWSWFESLGRVILVSAAFSIAIELAQWIASTGRQTSVSDVIMNTAGGAAGYAAFRVLRSVGRHVGARATGS